MGQWANGNYVVSDTRQSGFLQEQGMAPPAWGAKGTVLLRAERLRLRGMNQAQKGAYPGHSTRLLAATVID